MGLFSKIGQLFSPDPLTPRVYHCNPLLIVHSEDGIVYQGRMDVEFTPTTPDARTGHAKCLSPAKGEWQPELNVQARYETYFNPDPDIRTRGGFTLMGEDEQGEAFTWYIDRYADDYMMSLKEGRSPEELAAELQDEMAD